MNEVVSSIHRDLVFFVLARLSCHGTLHFVLDFSCCIYFCHLLYNPFVLSYSLFLSPLFYFCLFSSLTFFFPSFVPFSSFFLFSYVSFCLLFSSLFCCLLLSLFFGFCLCSNFFVLLSFIVLYSLILLVFYGSLSRFCFFLLVLYFFDKSHQCQCHFIWQCYFVKFMNSNRNSSSRS